LGQKAALQAPAKTAAAAGFAQRRAIPSQAPQARRHVQGGHDFSAIPIQPRLAIGARDDACEREADRVADQVMGQSRKGCCGAPASSLPQRIQTKPARSGLNNGNAVPAIVGQVLAAPGRLLDAGARAFMELRFGRDFSSVRVHSDAAAAASAQAIQALAYTAGSHIVLDSKHCDPAANRGMHLLAHELTHIVQQGAGPGPIQRQTNAHAARSAKNADIDSRCAGRMMDYLRENWTAGIAAKYKGGTIDKYAGFKDDGITKLGEKEFQTFQQGTDYFQCCAECVAVITSADKSSASRFMRKPLQQDWKVLRDPSSESFSVQTNIALGDGNEFTLMLVMELIPPSECQERPLAKR